MSIFKQTLAVLFVAALTACGGGGGTSGTSPFITGGDVGSPANAPKAANLVLQLDKTTIVNSGAANVKATAIATTSSGQALAGVPVTFSVDNKALFSVGGAATGAEGQVVATVSPGADPANRLVTVTATSGSLTANAVFAVTGAKLTGTAQPPNVTPGSTGNRVDFQLVNANDTPMAGQPITINAGSLPQANGVTGSAGEFSYTYTAPPALGALEITATAGGVTRPVTIVVAPSSAVPPAPFPVLSASVSANPSVVATNVESSNALTTNNRTEIRALFVGAGNKPVPNVRVRFDLEGDTSSVGGSFSAGDNTATGNKSIVYSDANGIATTAYIPGTRSSPTNGVTIRACYGLVDFSTCTASAKTTITVASEPLAVSIGSNELVYDGPNNLTYIRKFVVLVVDASGRAKGNVDIIPSIDMDRYYKGQFIKIQGAWVPGVPDLGAYPRSECFNEDLNRNGVNEFADDINHNGKLEPRKSDVAVSVLGSGKTDAAGTAIVQIEYPRNIATWARVNVLVAATGVSGTEGRSTWTEILAAPASAFKSEGSPAFVESPYGVTVLDGMVFSSSEGFKIQYFDNLSAPFGAAVGFGYPDGTTPAAGMMRPCQNPN